MFKKRLAIIFATLLIIVSAVLGFAACNPTAEASEKNITVFIGDKTFDVKTEQNYLHDVLAEMLYNGMIATYEYTNSEYGAFPSQVDVLTQEQGKYLSFWHSVDKFSLKAVYNEWAPSRSEATDEDGTKFATYTVENVKLYYSNVGVSALPIVDGASYAVYID